MNPFKPDSISGQVFARLMDGEEWRVMDLFAGLPVADPARTLAHIRKQGDSGGTWAIRRVIGKPGTVQLIW